MRKVDSIPRLISITGFKDRFRISRNLAREVMPYGPNEASVLNGDLWVHKGHVDFQKGSRQRW